jgi:hypothetical protein
MATETFARLRDWVEPAHPAVIKLQDDLKAIYTQIRTNYQKQIDAAFDDISRQIGFVVTTTVPVTLEVGDKGAIKNFGVAAEHLKGTLFDRGLTGALEKLKSEHFPKVSAGVYNFYLIWFDALNLKLGTHWMEPAHPPTLQLAQEIRSQRVSQVRPEVREPAHWFDPGIAISPEDAVLISVIDSVYPELHLIDRVAGSRQFIRQQVRPEVQEPAHFRQVELPAGGLKAEDLVAKIRSLLKS